MLHEVSVADFLLDMYFSVHFPLCFYALMSPEFFRCFTCFSCGDVYFSDL